MIKKEFLTILRDPKSRIIIIAPPLIQLALFANILTMETKNADIAVIDASNTLESREFVAGIENSRWFGRVIRSDNLRQAREKGGFGESGEALQFHVAREPACGARGALIDNRRLRRAGVLCG